MERIYNFNGVHCGSCANKIQEKLLKVDGIESCSVNFMTKKIYIESENDYIEDIKKITNEVEPGATVEIDGIEEWVYEFEGIHCGSCSAKIERKLLEREEIVGCSVNFMGKKIYITSKEDNIELIREIANEIEPGVKIERELEKAHNHENDNHHHHHSSLTNKNITLLVVGVLIFIGSFFISEGYFKVTITLIGYILVGHDILLNTIKSIKRGNFLDENFLMVVATLGAIGIKEYSEGLGVMIFYKIGEFFQEKAVEKSRDSIGSLMDIKQDYANLKDSDGIKEVSLESVKVGQKVVIKSGEKIPLDGVITKGSTLLETSALTGESKPRAVEIGDKVISGCVNLEGPIEVEVESIYKDSTVAKILKLVEEASNKKAKSEAFITKFARIYTPSVVFLAVAIFLIQLLIFKFEPSVAMYNSLVFLVVSCPCALVISIPLTFFTGIGVSSRNGILVKGGNYLEELNNLKTVVFDKTGTITKGAFEVSEVKTYNIEEKELLEIAIAGELYSNHPIGKAIKGYRNIKVVEDDIKDYLEVKGKGIKYTYKGSQVLLGNKKFTGVEDDSESGYGSEIYLVKDGVKIGKITVQDEVKEGAREVIDDLRNKGIKTYILTGDSNKVAEKVAKLIGVDGYRSDLLPGEKVGELLDLKSKNEGGIAFVGDGINDAPVLKRADIGISMGGIGSDAAIEASDIVLMKDQLEGIGRSLEIAKMVRSVVIQNIVISLGIKGFIMILGAGGIATIWEAIFADVGVALIAILNAGRILKKKW